MNYSRRLRSRHIPRHTPRHTTRHTPRPPQVLSRLLLTYLLTFWHSIVLILSSSKAYPSFFPMFPGSFIVSPDLPSGLNEVKFFGLTAGSPRPYSHFADLLRVVFSVCIITALQWLAVLFRFRRGRCWTLPVPSGCRVV